MARSRCSFLFSFVMPARGPPACARHGSGGGGQAWAATEVRRCRRRPGIKRKTQPHVRTARAGQWRASKFAGAARQRVCSPWHHASVTARAPRHQVSRSLSVRPSRRAEPIRAARAANRNRGRRAAPRRKCSPQANRDRGPGAACRAAQRGDPEERPGPDSEERDSAGKAGRRRQAMSSAILELILSSLEAEPREGTAA